MGLITIRTKKGIVEVKPFDTTASLVPPTDLSPCGGVEGGQEESRSEP